MGQVQANVWPPEKIMQAARLADIDSPTPNGHTENMVKNNVSQDITTLHESFDASLLVRLVDIDSMCGQNAPNTIIEGNGDMSKVTAAISVSLVSSLSPTF